MARRESAEGASSVRILERASWAGFCLLLLIAGAIVHRLASDPGNHVSWNVLWVAGAATGLALGSTAAAWLGERRVHFGLAAFAFGVACAAWALYQFDVLLPYEEWIDRGMPPRPF